MKIDPRDIVVGERDREPGEVSDLMQSMTEIGLLHPLVLTPEKHLVAGGRRLAAALELGWTEIEVIMPANMADLETALRAEMDENTCRRDLTPVQAERARARRAKLLTPLARESQGRPGKPRSSKLDEHVGALRKVASQGTGFSGSTLDKVAQVREVAEDETAPEPVREVAREALTRLDEPKAKVDREYQIVREAEQAQAEATLHDVINDRVPDAAADAASKKQRARWSRCISVAAEINTMSAEAVAAVITDSEFAAAEITITENARFLKRVADHRRPGLHAVGGNRA